MTDKAVLNVKQNRNIPIEKNFNDYQNKKNFVQRVFSFNFSTETKVPTNTSHQE